MRKYLFIAIACFAISSCYSQNLVWFNGLSSDSAKQISNQVVSLANTRYTFYKNQHPVERNGNEMFEYVKEGLQNPTKFDYMYILFSVPDTMHPRYYLKKVTGMSLNDVFPFWKRYINQRANLEAIRKDKEQEIVLQRAEQNKPAITAKLLFDGQGWQIWID